MSSYAALTLFNTPFGLREIRIVKSSTNKALTPAQSSSVNEVVTTAELLGDDKVVAEHSFPIKAEFTLGIAGVPIAAYALMTGRSISTAGLTPTQSFTMSAASGDQFPYFQVWMRIVADDGGDIWVVLYKCKLTQSLQGEFSQGNFRISSLQGIAIPDPDNSNKIYDFVVHETTAALPTGA